MENLSSIEELMAGFAVRTGLNGPGVPARRYLWTDAFAVCNDLGLFEATRDPRFLRRALGLVDEVHKVLGRFREDDSRRGWISGLSEDEGARHPTRGGLRIGKERPERPPGDPFDETLEWERDGQYFHYLTKWMHALDRVAHTTRDPKYQRWAVELAKAAYGGFAYALPGASRKRLHWKMSTDLSSPLVPSMGHHDPLDGLITFLQLRAGLAEFAVPGDALDLDTEIAEMASIAEGKTWETSDALGIGGLLTDAYRLARLIVFHAVPESGRLLSLFYDAEISLDAWTRTGSPRSPLTHRLAFRELGLSIGLSAIGVLEDLVADHPARFAKPDALRESLARLRVYVPWKEVTEAFWLRPENQQCREWMAHREINSVMLATSLGPDGYLGHDRRTDKSTESSFPLRRVPFV